MSIWYLVLQRCIMLFQHTLVNSPPQFPHSLIPKQFFIWPGGSGKWKPVLFHHHLTLLFTLGFAPNIICILMLSPLWTTHSKWVLPLFTLSSQKTKDHRWYNLAACSSTNIIQMLSASWAEVPPGEYSLNHPNNTIYAWVTEHWPSSSSLPSKSSATS